MNPRLGFLLLFEGDTRKVNASILGVTSFSAVTHVLKNGDLDVTALYISDSPTSAGNMLISGTIGGLAAIPAGSYRYFVTGTYDGKDRTWFFDLLVLPQDLSIISRTEYPLDDYDPMVESFVIYEGDDLAKSVVVPDLAFTAVTGTLRMGADNVTGTYCTGSAVVEPSGDRLTTHNIGSAAAMPAGEYAYFLQATYAGIISTWFFEIIVLPKQGPL